MCETQHLQKEKPFAVFKKANVFNSKEQSPKGAITNIPRTFQKMHSPFSESYLLGQLWIEHLGSNRYIAHHVTHNVTSHHAL
jgi:hypothetical protein